MKTCFKCSRSLDESEFYRHPQMGDGMLGKCKDCTKSDVREHRAANVARFRAYDKTRADSPRRRAVRDRVTRQWAEAHPEWRRAQLATSRAIRDGLLVRPPRCSRCREYSDRIEAHHWDYSRPLVVAWLCKPCHHMADKERRTTA